MDNSAVECQLQKSERIENWHLKNSERNLVRVNLKSAEIVPRTGKKFVYYSKLFLRNSAS